MKRSMGVAGASLPGAASRCGLHTISEQELARLRAIESAAKTWLEEIAGCSAGWKAELVVEAILSGRKPGAA